MAKIVLGKRPESFKQVVTFPMLDDTEGAIECEFKYRTKKEFGEFTDRMFRDAGESAPADGKFSLTDLMGKTVDKNGEYLMEVLRGWNLDEKLSLDSASQLANELPAAASAIMNAYRSAIVEGKRGN